MRQCERRPARPRRSPEEVRALLDGVTRLAAEGKLTFRQAAAKLDVDVRLLGAFISQHGLRWSDLGGRLVYPDKARAPRNRNRESFVAPEVDVLAVAVQRKCVTCPRLMMSTGAHHRMCNTCRARAADSSGLDTAYSVMRR